MREYETKYKREEARLISWNISWGGLLQYSACFVLNYIRYGTKKLRTPNEFLKSARHIE